MWPLATWALSNAHTKRPKRPLPATSTGHIQCVPHVSAHRPICAQYHAGTTRSTVRTQISFAKAQSVHACARSSSKGRTYVVSRRGWRERTFFHSPKGEWKKGCSEGNQVRAHARHVAAGCGRRSWAAAGQQREFKSNKGQHLQIIPVSNALGIIIRHLHSI